MSAQAHPQNPHPVIHGLMAEFNSADDLIAAARQTHDAGYSQVDAYMPYPIEEVSEALGHHRSKLPIIVLIGGLLGALGGYSLQFWAATIAYPMNVGGRPFHSWPAFIVPAFECTILGAALFAVSIIVSIGMWLERYIIIVVSLHRDFLPSSWGMYAGSIYDWSMLFGSMGLFLTLLFLFIRYLPMISIFEMRTLVPGAHVEEEAP